MRSIIEVAERLNEEIKVLCGMEVLRIGLKNNLANIAFANTPPGGWPGKNETEREANKLSTLRSITDFVSKEDYLYDVELDIVNSKAIVDMYRNLLRAIDMSIRDQANVVANGESIMEFLINVSVPDTFIPEE